MKTKESVTKKNKITLLNKNKADPIIHKVCFFIDQKID